MRGYYGIGVQCMKYDVNYGTLFRTANILGASFLFLIGKRFKKQCADTLSTERHIPLFEYADFADFNEHRPWSCPLVGIEMCVGAVPLHEFTHPERAIYLLGAEDHGLTDEAIEHCQHIVVLPGDKSMNVAVAGSIVLYDRVTRGKATPAQEGEKP